MSSGVVKHVTLANGHKIAVFVPENVEKDREPCRITKVGKPLKKGETPTQEHIYRVVTFAAKAEGKTKNVYNLTCNEKGTFKEFSDKPKEKKPKKILEKKGPAKKHKAAVDDASVQKIAVAVAEILRK